MSISMEHLSPYQSKKFNQLCESLEAEGKGFPLFPSYHQWVTPEFLLFLKDKENMPELSELCCVCGAELGIGDYVDHSYPWERSECMCKNCYEVEE